MITLLLTLKENIHEGMNSSLYNFSPKTNLNGHLRRRISGLVVLEANSIHLHMHTGSQTINLPSKSYQ